MRAIAKQYVDKKLIFRVRLFFIVFVTLIGIVVFEIAEGQGDIFFTVISFIIGILVGVVAGRMLTIKWHDDANKIVGSVDRLGVFFIILYLIFSLLKRAVLGQWFHGEELTILSLSIIAGIMFGRMLSALRSIRKILHHKKLLS